MNYFSISLSLNDTCAYLWSILCLILLGFRIKSYIAPQKLAKKVSGDETLVGHFWPTD